MALLFTTATAAAEDNNMERLSLPVAGEEKTLKSEDISTNYLLNTQLRGGGDGDRNQYRNSTNLEMISWNKMVHGRKIEEWIKNKQRRRLNALSLVSINVTAVQAGGPDLGPGQDPSTPGGEPTFLTFVVPPDDGPACKVFDVYILVDMWFSSIQDVEITFSKQGTDKSVTLYSDKSTQSVKGGKGSSQQNKNHQSLSSSCNETDHLYTLFADDASGAVPVDYNSCTYPDSAVGDLPFYKPTAIGRNGRIRSQSLRKTFAGEPLSGTWILTVKDVSPTGNLQGYIDAYSTFPLLFVPPCCTYSCGKNNDKFYLCHVPTSTDPSPKSSPRNKGSPNYAAPQTLCVDNNEYASHISHDGDYCGMCV